MGMSTLMLPLSAFLPDNVYYQVRIFGSYPGNWRNSMLQDFIPTDSTSLKCHYGTGEFSLDGRDLQLGPLAEMLIFRRRSLRPAVSVRLGECGDFGECLRAFPGGQNWAFSRVGAVGVLRIQHGRPSEEDDLVRHQFLLALLRSATEATMPKAAAQALAGAAGELIDNIEQHAGSGEDALAAFRVMSGALWLVVGDAGKGMLSTYAGFSDVSTAQDALRAAVVEHRSSTGDPVRGQGFRDLLRALQSLDASLRVRTGDASLETEGTAGAQQWALREQVQLVGCVVSAHVRW